jgi:hypothetical protein
MQTEEPTPATEDETNPWLTIWTAPKATIHWVIENDPKQWLWVFVVIGGISRVLGKLPDLPLTEQLGPDIRMNLAFMAGPFAGLVLVFGVGRVLHAVLLRMGGTGSWVASRTAIAWALAPSVPSLALWLIMLSSYGADVLSPAAADSAVESGHSFVLTLDYLIQTGLTLWMLVLEVLLLAEVHALKVTRVVLGELILASGMFVVAALFILTMV